MNIPMNCSECPFTTMCSAAHYGGSRCTYEKQIVEAIFAKAPSA